MKNVEKKDNQPDTTEPQKKKRKNSIKWFQTLSKNINIKIIK